MFPVASPSSSSSLHVNPRVRFVHPTPSDIPSLRRFHSILFPVSYSDQFYAHVLSHPEFALLAFFDDQLVGSVVTRGEMISVSSDVVAKEDGSEDAVPRARLYVMTLGVLSTFRRLGIGAKLLSFAERFVLDDENFTDMYLHVHSINADALAFYERFGFERIEFIEEYYKKILPKSCYVLSKSRTRIESDYSKRVLPSDLEEELDRLCSSEATNL